jgi:hypothetical protein
LFLVFLLEDGFVATFHTAQLTEHKDMDILVKDTRIGEHCVKLLSVALAGAILFLG